MRRCATCNINLPDGNYATHVAGKKHLHNLSKKVCVQDCVATNNGFLQRKEERHQDFPTDSSNIKLFVTGLPLEMTDAQLKAHFEGYPSVHMAKVDRKQQSFATLWFRDLRLMHNFKRQKHVLGKHVLKVHVTYPGRNSQAPKAVAPALNAASISKLKDLNDVPSQIGLLVELISLRPESINERLRIYRMLENVMRRFFPSCVAVPYGSSANGLGMVNSDLDICMDLKVVFLGEYAEADEQNRILYSFTTTLDLYQKQKPGYKNSQFLDRVQHLSSRTAIRLVNSIIRKYGTECIQLLCIAHARCPIVSFVHRPTKIHCDVSIVNSLAIHNTVLVRFFQQLDPRVRPLLMTIRFWAKQMEVIDPKIGRFSSYAITMLAIFYLQKCSPPILPTVEVLQRLTDAKTMCDGWECQFCMEEEKVPKTTNMEKLDVLLAGFFEFYAQHNLENVVLCLRTGRILNKPEFETYLKSQEDLGEFKMSLFNVQDMFQLNFNITRGVNEACKKQWHLAISKALDICGKKDSRNNGSAWDLVSLIFAKLEQQKFPNRVNKRKKPASDPVYQAMAASISSTPALRQFTAATVTSCSSEGEIVKKLKNT